MAMSFRVPRLHLVSAAIASTTLLIATPEAGSTTEAPSRPVIADFGLHHDPFLFGAWPPYLTEAQSGFGFDPLRAPFVSLNAARSKASPQRDSTMPTPVAFLTALTSTVAEKFERAWSGIRSDPFFSAHFGQSQRAVPTEPLLALPESFFIQSNGSRWLSGSLPGLSGPDGRGLDFETLDAELLRPTDIVVHFTFTAPRAGKATLGLRVNAQSLEPDDRLVIGILNSDTNTFTPVEAGEVNRAGPYIGLGGAVHVRVRLVHRGLFETGARRATLDQLSLEFTTSVD